MGSEATGVIEIPIEVGITVLADVEVEVVIPYDRDNPDDWELGLIFVKTFGIGDRFSCVSKWDEELFEFLRDAAMRHCKYQIKEIIEKDMTFVRALEREKRLLEYGDCDIDPDYEHDHGYDAELYTPTSPAAYSAVSR